MGSLMGGNFDDETANNFEVFLSWVFDVKMYLILQLTDAFLYMLFTSHFLGIFRLWLGFFYGYLTSQLLP